MTPERPDAVHPRRFLSASDVTGTERPHLAAYGISFGYRHGAGPVLHEVSFEVPAGVVCALIGPNGSGKSTLLKIVAGILPLLASPGERADSPLTDGQVWLRGQSFLNLPPAARARQIAYVGADLRVDFPITAFELVRLGRISHGAGWIPRLSEDDRRQVQWAMERALCWDLRDRDLHALSDGERQRVSLARGLAQGARVLFLDETLSRMDLNHQALIGRMLRTLAREEGYTVLLVSHDLNLACELADTALMLKAGRCIAYGPMGEVLTEARIQDLYPGAELVVRPNPVTGSPQVFFKRSSPPSGC